MARSPHVEEHCTGSATIRDIPIGGSDGRTVPFALAAGPARAVAGRRLIVIASASERAAGIAFAPARLDSSVADG